MNIKKNDSKKLDALEFLEKYLGGPLTLGGFIEAIRIGDELTQAKFAAKLKISRSHLNDIEKGRKLVAPGRAARYAKILGYSERQFIRFSLQAILDRDGVKMKVDVREAA